MSNSGHALLARAIGDLRRLPSPRGAVLELLRVTRSARSSIGDVARVAQADPALAARLIHAAGVCARGSGAEVGSIDAAVLRLGFSATRQIALAFSLVGDHRAGPCRPFDYRAFWIASLFRGLASRVIAARLRTGDPQEALVGGLLAGIGRLALATAQPGPYGELLSANGQDGARLRGAEQERFAIDHGALSVALLERWEMPAGLIASVAGYYDPPLNVDGPDGATRRTAWVLVLAETVAQALSASTGTRDAWTHLAMDAATRLGLDAGDLTEIADQVVAEAPGWTGLLELPPPVVGPFDFPGYAEADDAQVPGDAGLDILAVDDDESDRLLLRRKLEKAGHRVRLAEDGCAALESIAQAPPQLVITDIEMPRMDGLAFCRALRETRIGADLHVIAVTGRERHGDLVECIHAGANDFVSKAAAPETLLARVRAAARSVHGREALAGELDAARDFAAELAIGQRRMALAAGLA